VRDSHASLLQIHNFLSRSTANGPGKRAVIWVQGCSRDCPGCFNPETHSFEEGIPISVDELVDRITSLGRIIEGVSVSGGEPLDQMPSLLRLLRELRRGTRLSLLVFTGYTWEEVHAMSGTSELLELIDVLIAGPYDASQHGPRGLLGSTNQTVHLVTDRYTLADLRSVPCSEVIITDHGDIIASGIDPVEL